MKFATPVMGTCALLAAAASASCAVPQASVAGVVRDAHGVPQMGALVELLAPDASLIARAFTDEHGRYLVQADLPGRYELRASAAFLVPVLRHNLRLQPNLRGVADFTLTAIFQAGAWLPAERRAAAEPSDDWRWALRSTANRPLLRLVNDEDGVGEQGVSSSLERHTRDVSSQGRVVMLAGDGSFGQGGHHQVISVNRASTGGDVSVAEANLGDNSNSGTGASVMVAGGLEHQRTWGGDTRMVVNFASHPEIQAAGGNGLQVLHSATTQKIVLGDTVMLDAGTLFTAEKLLVTRFSSSPYIRAAYRISPEITAEYRLATDRGLQQSRDLDEINIPETALADGRGRPAFMKRLHQEIALARTDGGTTWAVALYHDGAGLQQVQGTGLLSSTDLRALPALSDPTTGTLRVGLEAKSDMGIRAAWNQEFSPAVTACVEAETGTALAYEGTDGTTVADLPVSMHRRSTGAVTGGIHLTSRRTGTFVEMRYRWQGLRTLTQVDEFDTKGGEAYATVRLRQKVWSGRRLKGVNAVVEATNLLAQGYQPILGSDGQTLFLAQVPRAVQGGLAFSF